MTTTEPTTDAPPGAASPPPEPAPPTVPQPLNISTGIAAGLPDQVDLMTGGAVKFVFGDQIFNLRRPSMPEFKVLRDAFQEVINAERKEREEKGFVTDDQSLMILGWQNQACEMLADRGISTVSDENIPPWMSSAGLVNDMLTHWREVPYRNK